MHKQRIISSLIMAGIVIAVLMLPGIFFTLCLAVVIGLGLNELFQMFQAKKLLDNSKAVSITAGVLIPLFFYLSTLGGEHWSLLGIVFVILGLSLYQCLRQEKHQAVMNLAVVVLGILYLSFNMSFMIKIRMMDSGTALLLYVLLTAKSGDIGAYFIGTHFGKHKLLPRLSPKKTIEGALAGLISSIVASIIAATFFFPELGFAQRGFLGFFLGVLAQAGDLIESLIKRDCEVKDSGVFAPGYGGVLDVLDSVIFIIPAFYFYLIIFN